MLILVWLWVVIIWLGILSKEESNSSSQWLFATQSWDGDENSERDAYSDLWIELDGFDVQLFARGDVFTTQSDDWWLINVTKLVTINKRKEECKASELERAERWWEESMNCGDGVLQMNTSDVMQQQFIKWDEHLSPWSKIEWEVLVAEDALLHVWKIAWIEAYALNDENIPTEIVSAMYSEKWIILSVKKLTKIWVSTVYQKKIDWNRESSLWIWLTDNGSLFFEVDKVIYATDYDIDTQMYVSINTTTKWVGMKNIWFDKAL